jgi:hypothetical protein
VGSVPKSRRGGAYTTTYEHGGSWVKKRTTSEGSWKVEVETSYDDRGRLLSREEGWSHGSGGSYAYSMSTPWSGCNSPRSVAASSRTARATRTT